MKCLNCRPMYRTHRICEEAIQAKVKLRDHTRDKTDMLFLFDIQSWKYKNKRRVILDVGLNSTGNITMAKVILF